VLAGVLTVNGSLNSKKLTVEPGGTLSGLGAINAAVINGGILSPGDAPGLLTIKGNYSQASSGAYNVAIASATSFNRLALTGQANLPGHCDLP
jgi:hypothetical protein